MKRLFLILALLAAIAFALLPVSLRAQTKTVLKVPASNALTESLVLPTGKTLTIDAGATITNNGTATGFGGSWGSITGTLSSQTDLQTALDAKASTASLSSYLTTATAASTYASLSGSYANPSWLTSLAWSKLTSVPALLTTFAALGNPASNNSLLGVDANGAMEYWTVSNGPSGAADADKVVLYTAADASRNRIQADSALFSTGLDLATSGGITLGTNEWLTFHLAGGDASFLFNPQNVTDHRFNYLPDAGGQVIALTSQADGSITASDVTGLAASATADTTNASNITSGSLSLSRLAQASATTGQVIAWNGSAWAPASGSGGATLGANTFTSLQSFSGTNHAGLRLNNLTTTQRDALASPAAGMVIWNTTDGRMQLHNGTAWTSGMVRLTGDTMTGVLALPSGSVSAPSLNFGSSGTGWYASASNLLDASISGTRRLALSADKLVITGAEALGRVLDLTSTFGTAYFTVTGGGTLFFSGGAHALSSNGELRGAQIGNSSNFCGILFDSGSSLASIRPSTTTLQIGAGAASPTAHIVRGASARAGTDSNTAGASLTLAGGNGTGTGGGGALIFQTAPTGSSGSTANTLTTRMTIKPTGVINMSGMPTSSAGLASGDLWNDSGVVKIVP